MNALPTRRRLLVLLAVLAVIASRFGGATAVADDQPRKNTKFPQQILIIRHAEKTGEQEDVHLAKQGQERAAVLEQLFVASKERPDPFPKPDVLFAAKHHKDSQRPVETVTPLAKKLNLAIDDGYNNKLPTKLAKGEKGMRELREELLGSPKYAGKTILVSWRHSTIPELAKTLGASKVPEKWNDNVFDRVWQLSYDDEGKVTFLDRPQRLLRGDSEK
jgi:hypothetical protein